MIDEINTLLEEVNEGSMTNVLFNDKNLDPETFQFANLLLAGDGIFFVQKTGFGATYDKLNVAFKNSSLEKVGDIFALTTTLPKPSKEVLETILECFKYINGKTKEEVMVNLYWDTVDEKFIIDLNTQIISKVLVDYKYSDKYEMNDRYVRYAQIHSHHSMAANFSGTDNNDEKFKIPCYFGVIGKLQLDSNIYTMDHTFRVWTGVRFVEVGMEDVFDLPIPSYELPKDLEKKLDKIIEMTKKSKSKKANYPPIGMGSYAGMGVPPTPPWDKSVFDKNDKDPITVGDLKEFVGEVLFEEDPGDLDDIFDSMFSESYPQEKKE